MAEPAEPTDDELTDLVSLVRRQLPQKSNWPGAEEATEEVDGVWSPEVTNSLHTLNRAVSRTLRERDEPVT